MHSKAFCIEAHLGGIESNARGQLVTYLMI